MKGKLGAAAANWLRKPENRDKLKRTARDFKARIQEDERSDKSRSSSAEHKSGQGRDEHREERTQSGE